MNNDKKILNYDVLKERIGQVVDPGFQKPLIEVGGIKKLVVGPTGTAELEIYLKDKNKNEQSVKIEIIKLVKIELGFPGIKIDFFESEFIPEGEKPMKYLAVASGKGGVGKSSVTANLAAALTRRGLKIGIIDADVYGPSIPHILEIESKPLGSTKDEKMIPLSKDGIEVVSTEFFMPPERPLMWRGPMLGKMLVHFFSGVKWVDNIDLILIDLPPGTGDVALDVKTYVPKSKVMVVTTPHVNAASVAVKAGLGAQNIGHEVIGVVENMSYYFNECSGKRDYIFGENGGVEVARKLGCRLFEQIPIESPKAGGFIYSKNDLAGKAYDKIAEEVIKEMEL